MAGESLSRWRRIRTAAQDFLEEKDIASDENFARSGPHRFAHFCLLVGKSFVRNRCPVRAASLAYTTLLALVPLLAVGVSITTSMLQKRGEEPVNRLLNKMVDYIAPALDLEERAATSDALEMDEAEAAFFGITNADFFLNNTNVLASNTSTDRVRMTGRDRIVKQITGFIANIRTGALTVTSVLALLFVGISLLRTIEATFNDIWGVTRGRGWVKSIVYYWAAITLGPIFLVGALTLTTGPHLDGTRAFLDQVPFLGSVLFHVLPFIILSLGFAAFYALMPNTKVHLKAALVGGIVGGCLWQLNNLFNVIYVSRVMSYTNIYGSLGVFPLFLVGMYFSWLIMLFGAQVAYAFQNRKAYIQERQAESVNQRGREFIALRLMTLIGQTFSRGERPLSAVELSRRLTVPSQLAHKVLCALAQSGLVVEITDTEPRFSPGRPLDRLTAWDVVCALRAGQGQELATAEDEARLVVRTEFERMVAAEREAGASISMQSLAELTAKQIGNTPRAALESEPPLKTGTS
jgi:membrane protein